MNRTTSPLEELSKELSSRSPVLKAFESTFFGFLMLMAVFGNLLTLIAVYRNKKLRTIPNLLVISLAISDLCMGLTCMPLCFSVLVTSSWLYGNVVCQLEGYVAIIMAACSTQTLAAMAVNRYIGIVKCLLYRSYFTTKRTVCLIITIWISSAFPPFVYLVVGDAFVFHPGKIFCYLDLNTGWFTAFLVTVYVGIPSTIILFCYAKVFQTINARNQRYKNSQEGDNVSVEEIRITRTLFVIVLFYMACWTPVLIIDLVDTFLGRWAAPRWIYLSYTFMATISCTANPTIYGIMNQSFRKEYLSILNFLPCLKNRKNAQDGSSSSSGPQKATKDNELSEGRAKPRPPYIMARGKMKCETTTSNCVSPLDENDEKSGVKIVTRL